MTSTWIVVVCMKYIASISMGKDSLAMLILLLSYPRSLFPLDYVVFYNTGMEFDCIYRIRDWVKDQCRMHGIQFVELHPDEPFVYCMFDKKVKNRDGSGCHYGYSWCGGQCRWATRYKIDAIRKFKQSLGEDCIDYVGIAADETHRLEKEKAEDKIFPLVTLGYTEKDCLALCRRNGIQWLEPSPATTSGYIDLYDILDRVSCWCCANKNLKELYHIYLYLPQYWERLKAFQARTERPMKGYRKTGPLGILELEQRFRLREQNHN